MKNIFKKIIAVFIVCTLFTSCLPLSGYAEEEGAEPSVETSAPAPAPDPEPESKPESKPKPEPEPAPVSEPESAPKAESEPESEPEPEPEHKVEEKPAASPENVPVEPNLENPTDETEADKPDVESETANNNEPAITPTEDNDIEDADDKGSEDENTVPPTDGSDVEEGNEPSDAVSSDVATPSAEIIVEVEQGEDAPAVYIVSFLAEAFSSEIIVSYGTSEGDISLPSVLKVEWSDGSLSDVAVSWNCVDDGCGGTEYVSEHTNSDAVFSFKAALAEDKPCNAELPVIYVSYDPGSVPVESEPLLWQDVIVEIDEMEYEVSYKSISLNVQKGYELGLSVTEDEGEEPNPDIKAEVDDEEITHNIIAFQKLESDTEYTVWAKLTDMEEWTAFEEPIETDKLSANLVRQEEIVESDDVLFVGETISVLTNLEEPTFKWYRRDQSEPISNEDHYVLTTADVDMGIKCAVSEGDYSVETSEVLASLEEPAELQQDALGEMKMATFSRAMPAGEGSLDEDLDIVQLEDVPEKPDQTKIVFTAGSQCSIDFSYTDLTGFEFAYRETGSEDELTLITGNPEVIDGLKMQTDYTLYFRSVPSEGEDVSEWEELGLNATTDQLEVTIDQEDGVYFDGIIAASPTKSYAFAEGYPFYQVHISDSSIFDGNAKLLGEVHNAELNLQELGASKADIGKYIFVSLSDGYGNTSAAKVVQLRRREDPLLSLNVGERIKVGETVEARFNGDDAEVTWEWRRGEEIIAGANTASYTATSEDANSALTVNVIRNEAVVASGYVAVDMCALTVAVDYVQETIAISVNEAAQVDRTLRVTDENGVVTEKSWPAETLSMNFSLSELGIDPDAQDASAPAYVASLCLLNEVGDGETLQLTLPTRKEYSGTAMDMSAITRSSAWEMTFVLPAGANMGLSLESGTAPDFSLGSGPSFSLKEGTRYKVWLQEAAVPNVSFAGKWTNVDVAKTETRKEVSVTLKDTSITWSPDMEIPGINISGSDVSKNDISQSWQGGEPSSAGKHTLKLTLKDNAAKWYKLKEDKLTLTIEPLTMSSKNTRVTCEKITYNGREQLPQKMKVYVDNVELPSAEFKVEKVEGYDCTKAGAHIIKVMGNGNVSGGIKIQYAISVAKPTAIAWPTSSYLVTGQKLSESKLVGGSTNAGSFAWENGSTIPSAGISQHNVVFTPADTTNYDWSGIAMVKPVEVKVYSVSASGDGSHGSGTDYDYDYSYDFSASSGYWDSDDGGYEEEEAENSSEQLAEDYLNVGSGSSDVDALEIVFDVVGQPMDYELLPIFHEFEEFTDHTFMVIAQPDMEGEIVSRVLRFSLAQLDYLHKSLEFSNLLFRNGDAEASLRKEELLTGAMAKLAAHMLATEVDEIDLMDLDFHSMEEPALTRDELAQLWLEVRIDPVVVSDEDGETEKEAWDMSLWLCTENVEVEVSTLIPSFTIGLNVNGIMDEVGQEKLLERNGIALVDENDEMMLLRSELMHMPGELPVSQPDEAEYYTVLMPEAEDAVIWTDYFSAVDLDAYRDFVLATPYSGAGMYMLTELEGSF